eukprot:scaffold542490_cov30-Prasinocladus_malaysianus.AAC.1
MIITLYLGLFQVDVITAPIFGTPSNFGPSYQSTWAMAAIDVTENVITSFLLSLLPSFFSCHLQSNPVNAHYYCADAASIIPDSTFVS